MTQQAVAEARANLATAEADLKAARRAEAREQFHECVKQIREAESRLNESLRAFKRDEPRLDRLESEVALLHRHLSRRRAIIASGLDVDEEDEPIDRGKVQAEIAELEAAIRESTPGLLDLRRTQSLRTQECVKLNEALNKLRATRAHWRTIAAGGTVGGNHEGGVFTVA